jgi:hypothetical protein
MDAEEKDICDFLKSWPGQYVAGREIARRAGGKWRFRDDPEWATPVLLRLLEQGVIDSDASARYRLLDDPKKHKAERWLSPDIKAILEKAGEASETATEGDKEEEG